VYNKPFSRAKASSSGWLYFSIVSPRLNATINDA
jgi:hypothetical protein